MKMQINSMKSMRAGLLKFTNFFVVIAISLSFFFLGMGCIEQFPEEKKISLGITDDENYEENPLEIIEKYPLQNIEVSLRNDKYSDRPLYEKFSSEFGWVLFAFSSSFEYKNEPGYKHLIFIDEDEFHNLLTDSSNYYVVVNDTASLAYNDKYETLTLKGSDLSEPWSVFYLPPKKKSE